MSFAPRQQRIAAKIRRDLGLGLEVADALFDGLLEHDSHDLASVHWTPIAVARGVVELLEPGEATRILDVGSGCGKFCLVAAMTGPGRFTGVELRPALVAEARDLRRVFDLPAIEFLHADALDLDWGDYDAFYFYNPFHENILEVEEGARRRIDTAIELNPRRFNQLTDAVTDKLEACRKGVRVVTFHGFGGEMPEGWFFRREKRMAGGTLVLYEKM